MKALCCRICTRKIRCFQKRFCNSVPAVVIALGHPEPFNHSPGHLNMKTPPVMITYLLLLNEWGYRPCISFAIAESDWSIVNTGVWFGFRCSAPSLTKFMALLSKAVAWAFSSKSGIRTMLKTAWLFQWDVFSTCDGSSFQHSVYNPLGLLFFPVITFHLLEMTWLQCPCNRGINCSDGGQGTGRTCV